MYDVREPIFCVIGRAAGFQVTDEFIAQLPQQLIIPNSHLQIFESIGEGKLQLHVVQAVLVGTSHIDTTGLAEAKFHWSGLLALVRECVR